MHIDPSTLTAAAVVTFVLGLGLGVIANVLLTTVRGIRRPMATRLPAPRQDCVVRSDGFSTTQGRARA